jgi:hypothetical protein
VIGRWLPGSLWPAVALTGAIALVGCPHRPAGPVAQPGTVSGGRPLGAEALAESVESVESGPAMAVVSLEVGSGYDFRARRLLGAGRSFAGETQVVYAVGRLRNVRPPGRVEGRWVHLDSDTHLGDTQVELVGDDVEARFSLSRPTAGWPSGQYKFYLSVNGEDVAGVPYSVTGAEAPTENPSPGLGLR